MSDQNNPLRQYFRRPAIYLKLPSGGLGYSTDIIDLPENGELPVYPMTAIDEITTKTPDALFNGDAIAELIKSCIPNIKNPYEITSVDFDAILIGIKTATQGNDYEINSQCPKCSEVAEYKINLVSLLSQIQPPDYDTTLNTNDLEIKFRPLTYKEMNEVNLNQFEVQRLFMEIENIQSDQEKIQKSQQALKMITELTMNVITKTIEYIQTPDTKVSDANYILDYLKNCDKTTYLKIRDHNTELKNSTAIKPLKIVCPSCSNNYEQSIVINATDFFG
jgi:hypothetical protein